MKFKINFYYRVNKHGCVETLAHVFAEIGTTTTLLIGFSKQNAMDVHEIGTGQLLALERAIHDLTEAQQKQILNSYGQKFPRENKARVDLEKIINASESLIFSMLYLSTNIKPTGKIEMDIIDGEVGGVSISCHDNYTELHIYSSGRIYIHNADGRVTLPHNLDHINSIIDVVLLAKI